MMIADPFLLPFLIPFLEVVNLTEHYWVTSAKRRRSIVQIPYYRPESYRHNYYARHFI